MCGSLASSAGSWMQSEAAVGVLLSPLAWSVRGAQARLAIGYQEYQVGDFECDLALTGHSRRPRRYEAEPRRHAELRSTSQS